MGLRAGSLSPGSAAHVTTGAEVPSPPQQYLEGVDEGQIVERDVIVVVLDVSEGLFMALHQCIDLTVFPLLHFVDLSFSSQIKLVPQHFHLLITLGLNF